MTTDIRELDTNKNYDFDPITKTWVEQKVVDPMKEPYYTVEEASKEARVKPATIRRAIQKGTLKAIQISDSSRWGFHYMVKESELISWLDDPTAHKRGNPNGWAKANSKPKSVKVKNKEEKPTVTDISNISAAIQQLIDAEVAKVKEEYELKLKSEYEKGFNDGKLEAELDHEDAYNRGVKDGKKKGIEEARAILKTL